jgi:hypothetical protein
VVEAARLRKVLVVFGVVVAIFAFVVITAPLATEMKRCRSSAVTTPLKEVGQRYGLAAELVGGVDAAEPQELYA